MSFPQILTFPIKLPVTTIPFPSPALPKVVRQTSGDNAERIGPLCKAANPSFSSQVNAVSIKPPLVAVKQPNSSPPPNFSSERNDLQNAVAFAGSATLVTRINTKVFESGSIPKNPAPTFTPNDPHHLPGAAPRFSVSTNANSELQTLNLVLGELSGSLNALKTLGSLIRRMDRRITK